DRSLAARERVIVKSPLTLRRRPNALGDRHEVATIVDLPFDIAVRIGDRRFTWHRIIECGGLPRRSACTLSGIPLGYNSALGVVVIGHHSVGGVSHRNH